MILKLKPVLSYVFILLFFFSLSTAQAQFVNKDYQIESIYLKGAKYVKNGIVYPRGFFDVKLKNEMEISPNAVIEFKKYQKKRNIALILSTLGLVTITAAIDPNNANTSPSLVVIGLGAALVAIPFSVKATNHFHKSIWIRNGDILK